MRVWSRTASMRRTQTEVAGAAQETFAGADDERQRFGREGVVAQAGAIQLIQDKLLDGFGSQAWRAAPSK